MSHLEAKLRGEGDVESSEAVVKPKTRFSAVSLLFPVQVVFLFILMLQARKNDHLKFSEKWIIYGWMAIWGAWGSVSTMLALRGAYQSSSLLKSAPSLWLPTVPLVLSFLIFAVAEPLRDALAALVDNTDPQWFVFIQGFRVLALGTVIKVFKGEFPKLFGGLVGGLDALYGLSACILFAILLTVEVGKGFLIAWHIVGVAIIVPTAQVVMQLSLPGCLYIGDSEPHMKTVWAFPMALAPTVVVPAFVGFNLLSIWRLAATS